MSSFTCSIFTLGVREARGLLLVGLEHLDDVLHSLQVGDQRRVNARVGVVEVLTLAGNPRVAALLDFSFAVFRNRVENIRDRVFVRTADFQKLDGLDSYTRRRAHGLL